LPTFKIETIEEVQDFVRGCAFYGTGGGGSPDYGLDILTRVFKQRGGIITITDPTRVLDNAWTTCAYGMGSIGPRTPKILEEIGQLGLANSNIVVDYKLFEAIKELEEFSKVKISAIVPLEIGGANTPDPVATAAHSGLTIVDGDYSGGRAIPEIIQTTPHMNGKSMVPLASVDEWGNTVLLKKAVNNLVAEKIGKLVSILAYGNLAGNATYLLPASEMKKLIVPGTLSKALTAGKKIRDLKESDKEKEEDNLLQKFARSLDGYFVFKGIVTNKDDEDREGYYWGTDILEGQDEFKGHSFKIFFKNENHVSWFDDEPFVTSPDIITTLDLKTMEPTTNPKIKRGDLLGVFVFKADERFRTTKGLEVLGPRHFGFNYEYVPMEAVVRGKYSPDIFTELTHLL
jgi:DUF917 family protein